jgi:hypothetical protein
MPQLERPTGSKRTPGIREGHPNIAPGAKRLHGTLVRIHDDGYGFIRTDRGEFYINVNSMRDRSAWHSGQALSFLPGLAREGKATPAYDAEVVECDKCLCVPGRPANGRCPIHGEEGFTTQSNWTED